MKEKIQKYLKIFGIYYVTYFILNLAISLFLMFVAGPIENFPDDIFIILLMSAINPLILIMPLIAFIPVIILLYFLFKKIKEKKARIFLIAFLIPFLNLIYCVIEHQLVGQPEMVSMMIGASVLFIILPLSFVISCCLPKRLLPIKKEVILTIPLMGLFGFVLIFCSGLINNYIDDKVNPYYLKKYDPIIEQIEEYKAKNGAYPKKVEDSAKKYKNFYYYTRNNDKDYILRVSNYYTKVFNYCSNKEFDECHPHKTNYADYIQFGKWIEIIEFD